MCPSNKDIRWGLARHVACSLQASVWVLGLPCVQPHVKNRIHKAPGLSLHRTKHQPRRKEKLASLRPGSSAPCKPSTLRLTTPTMKFHGGCFLPAFEEKTLCLELPFL